MFYAVAVRTKALQIFQFGLMRLRHVLYLHRLVVDLDTSGPMQAGVNFNRVHSTFLAGETPMGAKEPILLGLRQP